MTIGFCRSLVLWQNLFCIRNIRDSDERIGKSMKSIVFFVDID